MGLRWDIGGIYDGYSGFEMGFRWFFFWELGFLMDIMDEMGCIWILNILSLHHT